MLSCWKLPFDRVSLHDQAEVVGPKSPSSHLALNLFSRFRVRAVDIREVPQRHFGERYPLVFAEIQNDRLFVGVHAVSHSCSFFKKRPWVFSEPHRREPAGTVFEKGFPISQNAKSFSGKGPSVPSNLRRSFLAAFLFAVVMEWRPSVQMGCNRTALTPCLPFVGGFSLRLPSVGTQHIS